MARNTKKSRRWRVAELTQYSTNYELECKVSDRVAIVYAHSRPYMWATYGWPNENGKSHTHGQSDDLLTAKKEARLSLDSLVT